MNLFFFLQDLMNCCSNEVKILSGNCNQEMENPFKTPLKFGRRMKPTTIVASPSEIKSQTNHESDLLTNQSENGTSSCSDFDSPFDEAIFNRTIISSIKKMLLLP